MTAPVPRPYQARQIEAVHDYIREGRTRILVQSPTGSGKTIVAADLAHALVKFEGKRVMLMAHRKELVRQLSQAVDKVGLPHGIIAPGWRPERDWRVQVASKDSLLQRLAVNHRPDVLIIDEAHHAVAKTYRKIIEWLRPEAVIVGFSATPERLDGQPLDVFNVMVPGPSERWLIDRDYLVDYRIIAPPGARDIRARKRYGDFVKTDIEKLLTERNIVGNSIDVYQGMVWPRTCLVYCVSRNHAREVAHRFIQSGVYAKYVAGDTPEKDRDTAVAMFKNGNLPVIVSVDLFGEGLDLPGLQAVLLMRPTLSLPLYRQHVGRAMRQGEGKPDALIIDPVGNSWRHGLPDDEREWRLDGGSLYKPPEAEDGGPSLRCCEMCFAVFRVAAECPQCGFKYAPVGKQPKEQGGRMEELEKEALRQERARLKQEEEAYRAIEEANAATFNDWVKIAVRREYAVGWAARKWYYRTGIPLRTLVGRERSIRKKLKAES